MGRYSEDPTWSDISPLPTDEGVLNPLASIAYSEDYAETMSYMRAVMAINEYSPRVLELTEDLIDMNPAHYTVWLYRAQCVFAIDADLKEELEWLNETALAHQKNYQIWHHRFLLLSKIGERGGEDVDEIVTSEREFVENMFGRDAKNYHVWSYRQWLVKRFSLWDRSELEFTEKMLEQDVRNNSAWNHRWYVCNGREAEGVPGVTDPDIGSRETKFAMAAIARAPQNQSPWNYLRSIARKSGTSLAHLKDFAEQYADLTIPETVRSSFALDLLADILAEEKDSLRAGQALDLLATRYDPIRKNFWEYRKEQLGLPSTTAA